MKLIDREVSIIHIVFLFTRENSYIVRYYFPLKRLRGRLHTTKNSSSKLYDTIYFSNFGWTLPSKKKKNWVDFVDPSD